jgi:hypothetical protein
LAVRASCFSYRELWTEGGRDYRKSRKDDWQQQSLKLNGRAGNSGAHPHVARGVSAVKSQSEGYRAKAKEYARPPPLSARQILAAHYRVQNASDVEGIGGFKSELEANEWIAKDLARKEGQSTNHHAEETSA